ncbi:hypothetical protein AAFN60_07615 [Roseibacillus persicicus]|uniref:hypothetical protein n=1 Tax=Roseibacillus persicicus TaxID=454148 RepID=UPI00398BB26A
MKILSITSFILVGSLAVVSCKSDEKSETSDSAVSSAEKAPDTGNRFYDAAVQKFMVGPPEVDATTAKKIVDALTADGTIGLGEINSMALDDPERNSDRLNEAVAKARAEAATQ